MCQYANEKKNWTFCKKKYYNNPLFDRFSISSEILIDFGLTLFTVLIFFTDNKWSEVRRLSEKAYNLITENRKYRQSDKA